MMKIVGLLLAIMLSIMGNAQNQNSSDVGFESRRIINKKKFHVQYEEVVIDKTVDEVWAEVAGNFVNGGEIGKSAISSHCLTGDLKTGLGAERQLNLNFQGKTLEAKERIIDFQECDNHREFTYDVYETKGAPLKIFTYFTWTVKKGEDGKTYLSTHFIYRAKFAPLTGLVGKKLAQSDSLRIGLLSYKHYLETGEKKVDDERLSELYPRR